jgi:ACS family glucarate transporter-like MFS transporter
MDDTKRSSVRWLLIGWIFVISAISYLDRVNISIAGESIRREYRLSYEDLGDVFTAFVIGYALFQAPMGRLADRFGPRRILTFALVWWGIFTTLSAYVPTSAASAVLILMIARFALGVGEAVMYPASNRLVAAWIPSHERGVANGFIFAGVGAGAGITPPLIVYVMQNYGWRASFVVSAVIGVAAAAVWYAIARDKPSQHPWLNTAEREYIESHLPQRATETKVLVPWGRIVTSRELLAMSGSYFAYGYTAYMFFSWFFIYLNTVRGLDLKSSRYYAMLPFIAMAVCSPLGGWISDRMTRNKGERAGRCGIAVVGMALAAVFVASATQVESAQLATFMLAGGAGALYLSQSSFWSVTANIAGPSSGAVSGFMNMCGQFGGALVAWVSPRIASRFGWTASFLTAAVLCAIGAILWTLVDPRRKLFQDTVPAPDTAARAR